MCGKEITPDPFSGIFGTAREGIFFLNSQIEAVAFSSLQARHLVLPKGKLTAPPSHTKWVRDVMSHLKLERLKYMTHGSIQTIYGNHF